MDALGSPVGRHTGRVVRGGLQLIEVASRAARTSARAGLNGRLRLADARHSRTSRKERKARCRVPPGPRCTAGRSRGRQSQGLSPPPTPLDSRALLVPRGARSSPTWAPPAVPLGDDVCPAGSRRESPHSRSLVATPRSSHDGGLVWVDCGRVADRPASAASPPTPNRRPTSRQEPDEDVLRVRFPTA